MDYSAVLRTLELASKHGFAALRAYCQASAILLPKFTLKQENSVKQNFSFRQVDFNNNVLVPAALSFDHEVVPDGLQGCLATIGTKGDGNCLFRAVSMLLFEDDSEHIHLRVRAVFELCQNYDYYLGIELPQRQQDVWKRLTEEQQSHGGIMQRQINHNLLVSSFQQDVVELAKLNGWATMYAVEALSNVVGRKIYSVCPDNMCSRLKDVYHKVVNPIVCAGADLKMPICILWGKDGHIDTRKPYQPNHFLPLIKYQIIADQIKTGVSG